jgi:hypothetical protein
LKVNNFDEEGYLEKMEKEIEILEEDSLKDFLGELDKRLGNGEIKPLHIIEILRKYDNRK